jgi:ABC-type lipoprotein export system ATPase subunit
VSKMINFPENTVLESPYNNLPVTVGSSGISVEKGEIVTVTGDSGVGKTVFLLALMSTTQSSIHENNTLEKRRLSIQYCPQDIVLFQDCSLRVNFLLRCGLSSSSKALFERIPLSILEFIKSNWCFSPRNLSGGQRRAAAAVFAIESHPDVLVLDETLASMDKALQTEVFRYLRKEIDNGNVGCAIVISHDQEILIASDKVIEVIANEESRVCRMLEMSEAVSYGNVELVQREVISVTKPVNREGLWKLFKDLLFANVFAFAVAILVLLVPASLTAGGRKYFIPSVSDCISSLYNLWPSLVFDIFEGWLLSIAGIFLALTFSVLFLLVVIPANGSVARTMILACIAVQGVPTLVLARTLQVQLGLPPSINQVLIATTFLLFPLSVSWARLARGVPLSILWTCGRPTHFTQVLFSFFCVIASLGRSFVSCSPLVAIGVVVSGYVAGENGLGYKLFSAISSNKAVAEKWIYTESCVALSSLVMTTAFFLVWIVVPRDVDDT